MKNLKLIALLVAISISSVTFAMPTNEDPKDELRTQIVELLQSPDFDFKSNELVAEVFFTVNDKSELVVVSVVSDDLTVESFIKANLNYKQVTASHITQGKIYKLPLKIVKESI